jgi:hypothetical protein
MAISAKFQADFSSFYTAVQKAEAGLKDMDTGAAKVTSSLNRMIAEFSGQTIVKQATLATEAVARLEGGIASLTDKELRKLGAQADEAIQKLTRLGKEIPPGMQAIADAAHKIKQPLDNAHSSSANLLASFKSIAGALGIAFSAQALVGFVGKVFDAASAVKDLSDRLGVSIEAVQRFKYAAEQGGGTIDDVGASIAKMNDNLATGSKDTYEALKLLGLGFDTVRRQSPEDAFLGITDKLKGIEDPMLRTRLQMDLFGKASAGLGAQIASGFREASEAADVMSTSTVEDLEKAQQAWENLGNKVVIVSGNIIASTMRTVSQVTKSWKDFFVFVGNASTMGVGVAASLASATAEAANTETAFDKAFNKKFAEQQAALNRTLGQTKVEASAAAESARKYAAAMDKAAEIGVKAYKDHQKHLKDVADQTEAVNLAMGVLVNDRLAALGSRGVNILRLTTDEAVRMGLALSGNLPIVSGLGKEFENIGTKVTSTIPKLATFKLNLSDLSRSLADLATVSGSSFGAIASGFASLINAANTAKQSVDQIKAGFSAGFSKDGLIGMSTGIMGVVTAAATAINAIKALWDVFDRNKGRDAVKEFAESFGGFDQLHAELLKLGDAGEALWIKLTQGVGRNNPEQAARVIAEIEEALRKQAEAQEGVTGATEEQAQATIETATQAAKALEELGPKLKESEDQWSHWGDLVTAHIQAIADSIRAMPPIPVPAMGGSGSSGGTMPGGGGFPASFTVNSTVNIDGRVAGEAMARQVVG